MVTKKDMAVAILATFCLTSTLFMAIPTRSQDGTISANEYDPWIDTNDDGIIDIFDIAALALAFGAEGEPINKTAMLFDLQQRIEHLEEETRKTRTIRFFYANETYLSSTYHNSIEATVFTWVPNNTTNNAILEAFLFVDWKGNNNFGIHVNEFGVPCTLWPGVPEYVRSPVSSIFLQDLYGAGASITERRFACDQPFYEFHISIGPGEGGYVYVKNINLILLVVDGV